jgi:hypothetical protein
VLYATAPDLRLELGLAADDLAGLSDADATRLIDDAEDRVDEMVPTLPIDQATGRRIPIADLTPGQAVLLTRATVKLAAAAQRDPRAFEPARWGSIAGPDFSKSQPIAGGISPTARTARSTARGLLRAAGLLTRWATISP